MVDTLDAQALGDVWKSIEGTPQGRRIRDYLSKAVYDKTNAAMGLRESTTMNSACDWSRYYGRAWDAMLHEELVKIADLHTNIEEVIDVWSIN